MSEMKDNEMFVDSPVDGAQKRLEQLGYKQVLDRRLSVFGNVVMGLSNVAPVMAAFLYGLAAFSVAGTGAIGAAWMQGINVCLIGLILAEAGSIYPVSGGLYSLVKYMLPRPLAFVAVFTFMIQAFIYPPAISMGLGLYLQELFPALPQTEMATSVIAAIALILSLFIGLNNIVTSNRVAKFFLALQMIVIFVFLYICFANPVRPLSEVMFDPVMLGADGLSLAPVSFMGVLLGLGIMCAAIDGYPASLGFSEETKGSCRNVGKAVLITALCTVFLVVICMTMGAIAAPDLVAFLGSSSPYLYIAQSYMGQMGADLINIGIIIASFSCQTVVITYMSRVIFTGARDRIWPEPVNRFLGQVSKRQTPWACTVVVGVVCSLMVFSNTMVDLVTYGGMSAAIVYMLVAIGSINSRRREPRLTRPFRMPFFPLPPILVTLFLIVAIGSQETGNQLVVGSFVTFALLYYYLYIRPRDKKEDNTNG